MTKTLPLTNPWHTSLAHTELVPVNDDKLEVSISGPARDATSTQPLVIIEHGHGSSLHEWVVACRLISTFARVLSYSRAGYGRSVQSENPTPRTAANINRDLHSLLETLELQPPYVLVGHSYGGNIVRAFLTLYPGEVQGMVLVDSYCVYEPMLPEAELGPLVGGIGGMEALGEILGFTANHAYAPDEWARRKELGDHESANKAAAAEGEYFAESVNGGNESQGFYRKPDGTPAFSKQLLGAGRLSVLSGSTANDITRGLGYAKTKGLEDKEYFKKVAEWVELWREKERGNKACALDLSSDSRFVQGEGWANTHNLHFVRPDLVVEEVKWVLKMDEIKKE